MQTTKSALAYSADRDYYERALAKYLALARECHHTALVLRVLGFERVAVREMARKRKFMEGAKLAHKCLKG